MRRPTLLLATLVLGVAPLFAAHAETAAAPAASTTSAPVAQTPAPTVFSDAQKSAIQDIIKSYLTKDNPEVLMEAMKELQTREQTSAQAKTDAAIKTYTDKIFNDPNSPVGGNPKGDVTIVEFFDYQCGYCKMAEAPIEKLLKEDKNIRFIYKDFPILGAVSVEAGKASLASFKQGLAKYIKFHDALMGQKDHLSSDTIYKVAKDSGLDVEKLKKDMASDEIAAQVKANQELGGNVGVRGTPLFIIGEQVFPGALQDEQLKKAVDDARKANKK